MSVIEQAEITVTDGREPEFEGVLPKALSIVRAAAGCQAVRVAGGIERPGVYLLLVRWDSVDAHITFRATREGDDFVALIKEFFAQPPQVEHFSLLYSLH